MNPALVIAMTEGEIHYFAAYAYQTEKEAKILVTLCIISERNLSEITFLALTTELEHFTS